MSCGGTMVRLVIVIVYWKTLKKRRTEAVGGLWIVALRLWLWCMRQLVDCGLWLYAYGYGAC